MSTARPSLPLLEHAAQVMPALVPPRQRQKPSIAPQVIAGLTASAKWLSPSLFYDDAGSVLFDRITRLPEYYLTRAERQIFRAHADEIVALARASATRRPLSVLELGAGSASKTGIILSAIVRAQSSAVYQPLDVSASALELATRQLQAKIPRLHIEPHVCDYTRGYNGLTRPLGPRLALYIGSSIGNFEPDAAADVLRGLRRQLTSGDTLLIGVDLAPAATEGKSVAALLAAYDDKAGVTAAFNLNMLVRINRDLAANFDLAKFRHRARWNKRQSRIEMHLVSTGPQQVRIPACNLTVRFRKGETIHTENSYKYTPARLNNLLTTTGFTPLAQFTDSKKQFLVSLSGVSR
jgi:dimethylhistidine N-methyltransferase